LEVTESIKSNPSSGKGDLSILNCDSLSDKSSQTKLIAEDEIPVAVKIS
jgi:hypothetical protein